MAFPTRLLIDGEELVLDLRPHSIALFMPAVATVATLAVMLVLYDIFAEPILDMVVGIAGALVPARLSRCASSSTGSRRISS